MCGKRRLSRIYRLHGIFGYCIFAADGGWQFSLAATPVSRWSRRRPQAGDELSWHLAVADSETVPTWTDARR